jgi:hypothetical protein
VSYVFTSCRLVMDPKGCAIAQAVSRRLPTAAARVRGQVMWNLWWTKWCWGRFSPSTSVSPVNFHSTDCFTLIVLSSGAGTIGQSVADLPSGLSLTPPQETKKKKRTQQRPLLTSLPAGDCQL